MKTRSHYEDVRERVMDVGQRVVVEREVLTSSHDEGVEVKEEMFSLVMTLKSCMEVCWRNENDRLADTKS